MFLTTTAKFTPPSQAPAWDGVKLKSSASSKRRKRSAVRSGTPVWECIETFRSSTLSSGKKHYPLVHLLLQSEYQIYPPVPLFQMPY